MIYLITGVPGSGKTLYAVSKLLQQLLSESIKREDGGEVQRRLCVDGIPDLLLPHDLMAAGREASLVSRAKDDADAVPDGNGLWNWYEWCKPGDVIVVDEVQRYWRPRGLGTKVPTDIAKLETHRHYGVDFVLITQNPMLLDQNVRRLVGRHQHVRRLFGTARALVYDWDGCQSDTSRMAGATRTLFTYPKNAYKLYKSSELHTKQRQKIPIWFGFPLVVVALGAFAGPKAWDAMHRTTTGRTLSDQAPAKVASAPALPASVRVSGPVSLPSPSPVASAASASASQAAPPRLMGCISMRLRCECFAQDGARIEVERAFCEDASVRVSALPLEVGRAGQGSVSKAKPDAEEKSAAVFVVPNTSGGTVQGYDPDRQSAPTQSVLSKR